MANAAKKLTETANPQAANAQRGGNTPSRSVNADAVTFENAVSLASSRMHNMRDAAWKSVAALSVACAYRLMHDDKPKVTTIRADIAKAIDGTDDIKKCAKSTRNHVKYAMELADIRTGAGWSPEQFDTCANAAEDMEVWARGQYGTLDTLAETMSSGSSRSSGGDPVKRMDKAASGAQSADTIRSMAGVLAAYAAHHGVTAEELTQIMATPHADAKAACDRAESDAKAADRKSEQGDPAKARLEAAKERAALVYQTGGE
jgi:hypothetical protein